MSSPMSVHRKPASRNTVRTRRRRTRKHLWVAGAFSPLRPCPCPTLRVPVRACIEDLQEPPWASWGKGEETRPHPYPAPAPPSLLRSQEKLGGGMFLTGGSGDPAPEQDPLG